MTGGVKADTRVGAGGGRGAGRRAGWPVAGRGPAGTRDADDRGDAGEIAAKGRGGWGAEKGYWKKQQGGNCASLVARVVCGAGGGVALARRRQDCARGCNRSSRCLAVQHADGSFRKILVIVNLRCFLFLSSTPLVGSPTDRQKRFVKYSRNVHQKKGLFVEVWVWESTLE